MSCLWCAGFNRKTSQNVEINIDGWGWKWEKFCAKHFETLREETIGKVIELDGRLVSYIEDEEGIMYVGSSNPIPRVKHVY